MGLGSWSDNHLEPPNEKIVGYDWKGEELYGYEDGYMINGEFVISDDIIEYTESMNELVIASDAMEIDKYNG